jgi:hypothetical protein
MDRRLFIGSLAMGTLVVPSVASAQPARKVARIGVLGFTTPATDMTGPSPGPLVSTRCCTDCATSAACMDGIS